MVRVMRYPISLAGASALLFGLSLAAPNVAPASDADAIHINDVQSRVTESNSIWEKHAWQVELRNMAQQPSVCELTIEWLDADGFIIDDDLERIRLRCCGATDTFRGYALVSQPATQNVRSVNAKIACNLAHALP